MTSLGCGDLDLLASLKKHLQADEIDGAAVKTLVQKLGGETGRIGGRIEGPVSEKLTELGKALEAA